MATVAAIQAALDASGIGAKILAGPLYTQSATLDDFVVQGGSDGTCGRARKKVLTTLRADTAANQAATMLTALRSFR